MKAYKFRLYPNKATSEKLQWVLDRCRELYNAALEERKEAYRMAGKSISLYDQQNDLPKLKTEIRPEYQEIGAHVLQNVLYRVDKAYKAFFRRVKNGEKPGHPRFKGKNWYDSFTYPDKAGWKLKDRMFTLSKIGTIRLIQHREMQGKIKICTIKREQDQWYVVFVCEVEAEKLPVSYEEVGIDLGITHFAALSDGTFIDNPRHYRHAEKKLTKLQQALARKKRGSHRRKKAVLAVAKAHRKIKNQRKDFQHKASLQLVNRYQVIVFEDLQSTNMSKAPKPKQDERGKYLPNGAAAKAGLNKSIRDAGWGMFVQMVNAKAASAGRKVICVNPYKTSQYCSGCGVEVKKDLSVRVHRCPDCGLEIDRDTNAALNILSLGKKSLSAGTLPTPSKA
ncbi:MAG TPA: transposase [Dictyobacter sp.]|nr:transposase [Dictyobacter sp.]